MLEQGRGNERRSRDFFVRDEVSDRTARSYDELTERYTTRRELRAIAREEAGVRDDARSTWSPGGPEEA